MGQFVLAGILTAIGGIIFSGLIGNLFNGMDYGSAPVLGICAYLCAVVVVCTGIVVSKLDKRPHSGESHDGREDQPKENTPS